MIECKICGVSKQDTGFSTHLRRMHNMRSKEYYDKYLKTENEGKCIYCGKSTRYLSLLKGYKEVCGDCKHIHSANMIRRRTPEQIAASVEKARQTNLKRYGVINVLQCKEIQEKARQTKIERYGNPRYTNREKALKTMEPYKDEVYARKWRIRKENNDKFEIENNCTSISKLYKKYGQGWKSLNLPKIHRGLQHTFISNEYLPLIEKYSKTNHYATPSTGEKEMASYIKSLGFETIENCKRIINPAELDVYIPEKRLAFEFNGVYWHSMEVNDNKYQHLNKMNKCAEKGITLLQFTDYEWANKNEICKSIISSACGVTDRIYARQCEIREVNKEDAINFLENNHLQGKIDSLYRLGLYYKDELVQLIAMGKSRLKSNEIELLRMCSKLNTTVVGGFSKLLKHQPYDDVVAYIDRIAFTGDAYKKCGFKQIAVTKPDYAYYKGNIKLNKTSAQKRKLSKLLGKDNFDINLTEAQNMQNNNWLQVYDCGKLKMRWCRDDC